MTDWTQGHYGFGRRDGSSVWHLGTSDPRKCTHFSCIVEFEEEARLDSLKTAIKDAIPYMLTVSAHSIALSDNAMMPKHIAQRFQEFLKENR